MRLFIVRHGEAKHNLGKKSQSFAGSNLNCELAREGVKTACMLGEKIKKIGGADFVVASSLRRSKQTAEIISGILGGVKVTEIPELREFDVGEFAGLTKNQVLEKYPHPARAFYSGDIDKWRFPGGESFPQVLERVRKAFEKLKGLKAERVVICGHGMINRVIIRSLLVKRNDFWRETSYPHDRVVEVTI